APALAAGRGGPGGTRAPVRSGRRRLRAAPCRLSLPAEPDLRERAAPRRRLAHFAEAVGVQMVRLAEVAEDLDLTGDRIQALRQMHERSLIRAQVHEGAQRSRLQVQRQGLRPGELGLD